MVQEKHSALESAADEILNLLEIYANSVMRRQLKEILAHYALSACLDSDVRKEIQDEMIFEEKVPWINLP